MKPPKSWKETSFLANVFLQTFSVLSGWRSGANETAHWAASVTSHRSDCWWLLKVQDEVGLLNLRERGRLCCYQDVYLPFFSGVLLKYDNGAFSQGTVAFKIPAAVKCLFGFPLLLVTTWLCATSSGIFKRAVVFLLSSMIMSDLFCCRKF